MPNMPATTDIADGVLLLTIDRPPANALDIDAIRSLERTFRSLASNPPAHGVVLTGAGAMFCAGVDTRAFAGYDGATRLALAQSITRMTAAILALPVALVGAINGHALGGGLVLALCCDWRIAVDEPEIKLGLPEAAAGVPFPAGPTAVLQHELVGSIGRHLALSSAALSPQRMQALGAIDAVYPRKDLLPQAIAHVLALARQPGFGVVKRQVRGPLADRLQALADSGEEPFWAVEQEGSAATSSAPP